MPGTSTGPRELLKKIRKIEIFTAKLVNDQLAGQYQSVFKGRFNMRSKTRRAIGSHAWMPMI